MVEVKQKEKELRIAFFGESVAYGFLLAPHFTPSSYLEKRLAMGCGRKVTVLDETKVSIRMKELCERFTKVDASTLDMAIVFTGNNWRKDFWNVEDATYKEMLDTISKGRKWDSVFQQKFQEWMDQRVQEFFDEVKKTFCDQGVPVLFIIPECNLRNWGYNYYETTSNWPTVATEKLIEKKDWDNLSVEIAEQMIKEDPTNPLGYFYCAKQFDKAGETNKAFDYYRQALNTNIFRLGPPPAINDYIRSSIIKAEKDDSIEILDLRQEFNHITEGEIAGNQYFIDYCHLSVDGIMKTCNRAVVMISNKLSLAYQDEYDRNALLPRDEVVSNSYFYAALHSCHSGNLDSEYLEYLLQEAIRYNEAITQKMIDFVHLAYTKTPWRLNEEYLKISSSQYPTIRQPEDCMVMDKELVDVMVQVLESHGISIQCEAEKLRLENYGVRYGCGRDLLETYYRESSYFNTFLDSKSIDYDSNKLSYCAFRNPYAMFYLVSETNQKILVEMVARSPYLKQDKEFVVRCNNQIVFTGMLQPEWAKYTFCIESKDLNASGMNELIIDWPHICGEDSKMQAKIEEENYSFYDKFINRMRPIYGELYRLDVAVKQ